ncbi:MAG TPA: stage VI sporulation protein F [Candidatus Dormibacteraeota bacterium]|nr:stage VI sporulation protein F [Candidatus Dormibacteraeota bacterium]
MSELEKDLFDKIKQSTNVNPDDVYRVAESVRHADFSDEQTVRNLVQHLARMANKRISKEKEDQIVQSITKNNMPVDMQSLNRLFKR